MQIYGIFTENRGKYAENRGKCTENRGISEESIPRSGRTEGRSCGRFRSFPVVFGRNSLVFPVIPGHFPIDSGKSFLFFPFYTSSSSNHPDFML